MSVVHVIAVITAHPGKRQNILDVLHPGLERVHDIPGCIEYTVTIDADVVGTMHTQTKFGPDTYATIEKWESLEHLKAHSTAPEIAPFFEKIQPYLKSRVVYFLQDSQ